MRRHEFITVLDGAITAWPLAAFAQQQDRIKFIGAITGIAEEERNMQARYVVFLQELQDLGWVVGRNLRIAIDMEE
jgi:hypothetical protein